MIQHESVFIARIRRPAPQSTPPNDGKAERDATATEKPGQPPEASSKPLFKARIIDMTHEWSGKGFGIVGAAPPKKPA
jgi:hypothetical protein